MLACEGLRRAGRQHPIVGTRRGTKQQEEPRGLQIADSRETAEQLVLDHAFAAKLTAHESFTRIPSGAPSTSSPRWSAGKDHAPVQTGSAPTGWRRARPLGSSPAAFQTRVLP